MFKKQSSKCIASFAVGPALEYQKYTIGPLTQYAQAHHYDLHIGEPKLNPPSWAKIPLMLELLETYDHVLWIDADVMIVDGSADILGQIPKSYMQGLVKHKVGATHICDFSLYEGSQDGFYDVPNCGVWYVNRKAFRFLESVLELYNQFKNHPWWEQAAFIHLLNKEIEKHTWWLLSDWNRHPLDINKSPTTFLHATTLPDRTSFLRELSKFT